MSKGPSYTRQIVLTVIISVLVLAAVTACVFLWLLPEGVVEAERVYYFATRLFPLVIGFVMIQVGIILSKRNLDEADQSADPDALPPNSYDRSLYQLPGDDPSKADSVSGTVLENFESVEESEKEEEVATTLVIKPASSEEARKEEEIEPFVAPVPVAAEEESVGEEEAVEEPAKAEAEPEEEAADVSAVEAEAEEEEEFDNILSEVLPREIASAVEYEYSLTLVRINAEDIRKVTPHAEINGIPFEESGSLVVIFPFFNRREAEDELAVIKAASRDSRFRYKLSELEGRMLTSDEFLSEV